ncbi:MAG: FAD-dependent oxidoreductase [Chloroflexi bacterium]|nr:FAD-dependent oxidoreductase [Chloroflexota bacterium]
MSFTNLFKPGKIGGLELKNRIVLPAMGTGHVEESSEVTDTLIHWYARRARGGAGLITVEACFVATIVDPIKTLSHSLRADDSRFMPGLARLAEAIHKNGAKAGIQFSPGAGAQAMDGPWVHGSKAEPVSPSGVYALGYTKKPRALTMAEVEQIAVLCASAARNVKEAGFDLIELHAHYGYLLAQFLSTYFNKRTDKYGGSLDNRLRLLLDIVAEMRKATGPGFPIIVKYSIDEYIEGGRKVAESQVMARKMEEVGVDGIGISAGAAGSRMPANPPYFFPQGVWMHLAAPIKQVVDIPVILPGRLNAPRLAEQVLKDGKADFVAIGRGLIADPDWPQKVANGEIRDIRWCISCNECRQTSVVNQQPLRCTVNAIAGREGEYDTLKPATVKKKVVVVGGGPAGMETARVAALRGHDVTLFEQRKRLGGLMSLAGVHNEGVEIFTRYLIRQIGKLPVCVMLQTRATPAIIQEVKPDAVILAIGGTFPAYKVPGINRNNVFSSKDLFELTNGVPLKKGALMTVITAAGKLFITTSLVRRFLGSSFPIGKKVAVIGGQFPGCSLALSLAKHGKKVTIIEESDHFGSDMEAHTLLALKAQIEDGNIRALTSTRVDEITGMGVTIVKEGKKAVVGADSVILALNMEPATSNLAAGLNGKVKEVYTIGDAKSFRRMTTAIAEGFETACRL